MTAHTPSAEIANVEPAHQRVAHIGAGSVTAIVPQTFDDVYRFAQVLSRSGLVPYGMDTPEKVSVAILTGLEIGVKPMQAIQGIAVINGAPRIWGDLALATVRGSGQLEQFKETLVGTPPKDWTKPVDDELNFKAVCMVKRRGEDAIEMEYSIGDAIVAKLWNKTGPKGPTPWVTNPKRMLKMRARAFALRDAFTDVLKGMPIADEMVGEDVEDVDFAPVSSSRPAAPPVPSGEALGFQPGAVREIEDATILSETAAGAPPPSQPAASDAEASSSNPPAGDASASETFDHNDINPDDEIGNLIDKLAHAKDEATVEEWYVETDIEAALSGFEGYVEKARGVRDQHLQRVRKAAAAEQPVDAPAPPPPSAGELDDDAPAPPAAGPDLSTIEGYQAHLKAQLDAARVADDFAKIRAWWTDTRDVRNKLDMSGEKRVELQEMFGARKTALGIA